MMIAHAYFTPAILWFSLLIVPPALLLGRAEIGWKSASSFSLQPLMTLAATVLYILALVLHRLPQMGQAWAYVSAISFILLLIMIFEDLERERRARNVPPKEKG